MNISALADANATLREVNKNQSEKISDQEVIINTLKVSGNCFCIFKDLQANF